MRKAAIDIGTNTVRLLVKGDGPTDRRLEVTRLGEGVDRTGILDSAAMQRSAAAVASYAVVARELGAVTVRAAATSAVRDSANRQDFIDLVSGLTGIELEVLSGEAEGRLSYAGALLGLPDDAYVVIDIGGGSTELITAGDAVSLNVGSVRVRERCLTSDPPRRTEIAAAEAFVDERLQHAALGPGTLIGVGGTATTLAALAGGLKAYDPNVIHHSRISAEAIDDWSRRLLSMPVSEIKLLPTMLQGRADVIGAGALILSRAVNRLGVSEVVVSETDILDGLVIDDG